MRLKKIEKFKTHRNKHHVYPTSRFILKKNPVLHTAWHDVFQNMAPEEAIEKVKDWIVNPEKFKDKISADQRKALAWKMLFGDSIPSNEVIKIIERDWTFPGVRMIKLKRT